MHDLADLLLDKAGAPWFDSLEKDKMLNLAMMEFVKTRYKELETNEKRRKDLISIVKKESFSDAAGFSSLAFPHASFPDLLFILGVQLRFNKTCDGVQSTFDTYAQPRQWDDHYRNATNSFNKPTDRYPVYTEYSDNTLTKNYVLIHSTTAPIRAEIAYLATPDPINATVSPNSSCVLPEHTHEEIVNLAVRKMMSNIADERIATQINEINNQE